MRRLLQRRLGIAPRPTGRGSGRRDRNACETSASARRCSSAARPDPDPRLIDRSGGSRGRSPSPAKAPRFLRPDVANRGVGLASSAPVATSWSRRAASASTRTRGREEAISGDAHPAHDRCARWFPSTCRARSSSVSSALLVRWASSRRQAVSVSWATPSPPLASGLLSMPFYVAAGAPSTAGTLADRLCLGFSRPRTLLLEGHGRRPDTALRVQVRRARSEDTGRRCGVMLLCGQYRSFGDGQVRQ